MNNIIHSSFKHGNNFTIGSFCIIDENVIVGDNVTIENYVYLKSGTNIGDNVFIDSYVRSSGDNEICDNAILRYGSTIARYVKVCRGAFVSPNVMTIYSTHDGKKLSGTVIGENAFIGTAAVLGPGVTIGPEVVVGSMAYVSKDCLRGTFVGIPAKRIR